MLEDATHPRYHVGDHWSYKTRPGDEASTLTILKIESHPQHGTIFHVAVDGARLRSLADDPAPRRIDHMPFAAEAIDRSVSELIDDGVALPDFAEGYSVWRAAFDSGRGGVFRGTVAEAVAYCEQVIRESQAGQGRPS